MWKRQEYYNQYLDLKEEIQAITYRGQSNNLEEKVQQMRFLLQELELCGVNPKDLLLLSMGIEINLFKKHS